MRIALLQAVIAMGRPTKRAPDGWWAPRFELDSSEKFGSVSWAGSPQPPVTQAVSTDEPCSFMKDFRETR